MKTNSIKCCWNCKHRTTKKFPSETGSEFAKYFFMYGCKAYEDARTVVRGIDNTKFKQYGCEKWEDKTKKKRKSKVNVSTIKVVAYDKNYEEK